MFFQKYEMSLQEPLKFVSVKGKRETFQDGGKNKGEEYKDTEAIASAQ